MEELKITKEGRLVETYWHYDEETDHGEYREKDVTDQLVRNLFDYCDLEDGVTLKSIFKLMNNDLDTLNVILGNWCKEIVTEGLTKPEKPYSIDDDEDIEYLELYWYMTSDKHEESGERLYGFSFPALHGIGVERKKDKPFGWENEDGSQAYEHRKGERTNWGVSFTPTNELINIPIKLNRECKVYRTDYTKFRCDDSGDSKRWYWEKGADEDKVIAELDYIQYTLGHILYGILWELSFSGGPDDRDNMKDSLNKMVEDIKREHNE